MRCKHTLVLLPSNPYVCTDHLSSKLLMPRSLALALTIRRCLPPQPPPPTNQPKVVEPRLAEIEKAYLEKDLAIFDKITMQDSKSVPRHLPGDLPPHILHERRQQVRPRAARCLRPTPGCCAAVCFSRGVYLSCTISRSVVEDITSQ